MAIRRMRLNRGKEGDTGIIKPLARQGEDADGYPLTGEERSPFDEDLVEEIVQMAGIRYPDSDTLECVKRAIKIALSTKNFRDALEAQLYDPNDPPHAPTSTQHTDLGESGMWQVGYMGGLGSIVTSIGTPVMSGIAREQADRLASQHNAVVRTLRSTLALPTSEPLVTAARNALRNNGGGSVRQLDVEIRRGRFETVHTMSGMTQQVPVSEPSVLITILGQGNPVAMLQEATERFFEPELTTIRNV